MSLGFVILLLPVFILALLLLGLVKLANKTIVLRAPIFLLSLASVIVLPLCLIPLYQGYFLNRIPADRLAEAPMLSTPWQIVLWCLYGIYVVFGIIAVIKGRGNFGKAVARTNLLVALILSLWLVVSAPDTFDLTSSPERHTSEIKKVYCHSLLGISYEFPEYSVKRPSSAHFDWMPELSSHGSIELSPTYQEGQEVELIGDLDNLNDLSINTRTQIWGKDAILLTLLALCILSMLFMMRYDLEHLLPSKAENK